MRIVLFVVLVLVSGIAEAQTFYESHEISMHVKAASIALDLGLDGSQAYGKGSGTMIAKKKIGDKWYGVMLTCGHLFWKPPNFDQVHGTFRDEKRRGKILKIDKALDVALLLFEVREDQEIVSLALDTPAVGDRIQTHGYPYESMAYSRSIGVVDGYSQWDGDERTSGYCNQLVLHDASLKRGMSGGGMFNTYGEIVAINSTMLNGEVSGTCVSWLKRFIQACPEIWCADARYCRPLSSEAPVDYRLVSPLE